MIKQNKSRLLIGLYSRRTIHHTIPHSRLSYRSFTTFNCYPLQYIKHTTKQRHNCLLPLTQQTKWPLASTSKELYSNEQNVATEYNNINASFTDTHAEFDVMLAASIFIAFGAG